MIYLSFVMGSKLRKITIDGRVVSMLSSEVNFLPFKIDLNKLTQEDINKYKMDKKLMDELKELKTEEEISQNITKEFRQSGWRKIGNVAV